MNVSITELKHEKEVMARDLVLYQSNRDSVKQKYTALKKTHLEVQQTKERYLLEVSQLNSSVRDKEKEIDQVKAKSESLEKTLKDKMAQEMKAMMMRNRETEDLKKQIEALKSLRKETEDEGH